MNPLRNIYRDMESQLRLVSVDYIIDEAREALYAFEETGEFEHLVDLYFAASSLIMKESEFDEDILRMLEDDLEFLYYHLN